ncbi:MAG TPA: hypothetical protein VNS58_11985 [Puia sp.]|nr:hypothetical protein [Puia sp.]
MITLEQLTDTFGDKGSRHFEYLRNKNKGGVNNSKGNIFENFFTVYQIAKSFNNNANPKDILFSSQVICFIDDLVIEDRNDNKDWHYQIKDVVTLGWNTGKNPIEQDFRNQREFSVKLGIDPYLTLVISNKEVHDSLVANMPAEIVDFVEVVHFETASSLNNLIRKNFLIKDELIKMCALENPSADKLETLGAILLGSWDSTDKRAVSLEELLNKSYAQNPHFIKGLSTKISEKLSSVFRSVERFKYKVENGFLIWDFNGTDNGILEYRIGSMEYEQWENDIFNATIKTFEDLELFLVS